MWKIFSKNSPYIFGARILAIGWTLLIFILCLLPGNEIPDVDIPFVDKWAHVILFAVFSFLWLCAGPTRKPIRLFSILLISIFVGWLVEYIQGHYIEGRYQDNMDTLADALGGLIGIIFFATASFMVRSKEEHV